MTQTRVGRTYNQNHVPRTYTPGKRRFSIYWTWSYPWEANRDINELDNRFSTMAEVRRSIWPNFEATNWDKMNFLQGIAGTLELFHRSTISFQDITGEATGHPVAVYQRIDQAGYKLPIDERVLADTDTLMVFGLDHLVSEQDAAQEEIDSVREWLTREGTCLLLAPHHDVGFTSDMKQRQMEYTHHGDDLARAIADHAVGGLAGVLREQPLREDREPLAHAGATPSPGSALGSTRPFSKRRPV